MPTSKALSNVVKLRNIVDVQDPTFGAKGTGAIDDTAAMTAAFASAISTGHALFLSAGTYLCTSSLPTITGSFTMYGEGPSKSTLLFVPTAADTLLELNNGASRCERVVLHDFAMKSTDNTYAKIALDVYDLSVCTFERLLIWGTGGAGPSAGACWSDAATSSIGIRTHGREATGVKDIEIVADRPIVIAANPNTTRSVGEDMDHWCWENCYLIANNNYIISVDDGIGIMETGWEGEQAWVGGTGGFKINDTRVAPTITSRGIRFHNVRHEQMTDAAGFSFNMVFTDPVQNIRLQKVIMAAGANGITINGFLRMVLDEVTAAQAAGKTAIVTAGVTSKSVLAMRGCIWQTGSLVTLTGLTAILIAGYRSADYAAPSDAVYAGQITDTLVNVGKVTSTVPNATEGLLVTAATGDAFQVIPNAAAAGVSVRALNNAKTDFTPMSQIASTFERRYRTGVGTSAVADQIDTAGQVGHAKRMFPAKDDGTIQTNSGLFAGNGVPSNANGSNGDFYLRGDGTQAGSTVIYHKEGGAWVALVTT